MQGSCITRLKWRVENGTIQPSIWPVETEVHILACRAEICLCKKKVPLDTTLLPYLLALAQRFTSTHRCSRPAITENWERSEKCATIGKYLHPRCVSERRERLLAGPQQSVLNKKNLHTHARLMAGQIKLGTTWQETTTNNATSINKHES